MPKRLPDERPLATTFRALSDPTRLAVVERLTIGPAGATELARPFGMALPSFMQHLSVLESAGIVTSHKAGRTRVFQLASPALREASDWLGAMRNHWERRLDQLDRLLLGDAESEPSTRHPTRTSTTPNPPEQEHP